MGVVYFSIIPTFEPSRYCKCWIVCFYNRISFPVDNVDEDRYHTCYNIMYVLYHSDAEKFLQYCEKIKEDCDHMSRHRIEVLVEEIVKK